MKSLVFLPALAGLISLSYGSPMPLTFIPLGPAGTDVMSSENMTVVEKRQTFQTNCSPEQQAILKAASEDAVLLAPAAAEKAREKDPALELIFKSSAPDVVNTIATRFDAMVDVAPSMTYDCAPRQSDCDLLSDYAFTIPDLKQISLCSGFWPLPATSCEPELDKVRVIFHELTHQNFPGIDQTLDTLRGRIESGTTEVLVDDAAANDLFAVTVASSSYC